MTVLFFSRLFSPHIGGVEKHVYEISQELIRRGHRVTILTENIDNKLMDKEVIDGIQVFRIRTGKDNRYKKFKIWSELWKYKSLFYTSDVIHCHDIFFWYLPFRILYPHKKVYTTFHGYEGKFPPSKKAIIIRKISELLSFGNICVGSFIEKWYGTHANYVTYGGVRIANKVDKKKEKGLIKIVFIGRLEEDTGILFYMELVKEIRKIMQVEFIIVGDGPFRKKAEKVGIVTGFVKSTSSYIAAADMVFVSSYLAILEALSMQKFIISFYDNQLKKDYLTMTPFVNFITIVNQVKEANKIILRILGNNKISIQNKKGYNWANYQTWGKVTDKYLLLWND